MLELAWEAVPPPALALALVQAQAPWPPLMSHAIKLLRCVLNRETLRPESGPIRNVRDQVGNFPTGTRQIYYGRYLARQAPVRK